MSARARLLRSFATVGGWTLGSRILGFLRDISIAAFLGAGPVAEAFFIAFRLPNMFRRFFAEGAFNAAFVPMFTKTLEGDGLDAARAFATRALAALLAALIILTLLAQAAMPWMVLALASGQRDTPTFDLAVDLSRITFPYILFISVAALFSGVLNAFGRFAAAAAAPALLNVILIGAILGGWAFGLPLGHVLSGGVAIAGVAQLVLLMKAARAAGMTIPLAWPRLTPDIRRLVMIGVPAALAGGVTQINLLVGTQIASYFDGAIGWLWYADRLFQLPLGVIGIAVGIVLLPELSRHLRRGDTGATREAMNRAGEFAMLLTLPATVALLVIPGPIVGLLFERGAFTPEDTAATAVALAIYAAGLPVFVLQKILTPAFFAREDTRRPVRYAVLAMVVNLVGAIALMPVAGFLSVAIAGTVAAWLNTLLLWRGLRRMDPALVPDLRLMKRFTRMVLASFIMGGVAYGLSLIAETTTGTAHALVVTMIVLGCGALYFALALGLGAASMSDLRLGLRRGTGR